MQKIIFMKHEEDYFECRDICNRCQVIYGMGIKGKYLSKRISNIDFFCDKKAKVGEYVDDIPTISPYTLNSLEKEMDIIICVANKKVRDEIKSELSMLDIDAHIFDAFDNCAFDLFVPISKDDVYYKRQALRYVRVVDSGEGWILSKFANEMKRGLEKRGIRADIGTYPDSNADMNYYTFYGDCEPLSMSNTTFMITHVNNLNSVERIKHSLKTAQMGICMSYDTMDSLVKMGVSREKLCYINPAHDNCVKPKKYILGITHRCYDNMDKRKRASAIIDIVKGIDPQFFCFKIMGAGWERIVDVLRQKGFEVLYFPEFDKEEYSNLISSIDYYMYWGFDEGSMGYLDALAAGVKTIVTPQGYHLDTRYGLTYSCRTIQDFRDVLLELEYKRKQIINTVSEWTWDNFVEKHIEVWNYLLDIDDGAYCKQHLYEDGIFSVMPIEIKN